MKSYIAYPTEQQARAMTAFFDALDIPYEQVVSDALPPGVFREHPKRTRRHSRRKNSKLRRI